MVPVVPIPFWQFLDVISVGIISIVIIWITINFRRNNDSPLKTISHTVAHTSRSSLVYSITMTIFFPLYYAFLWFWVGPTTGAPTVFYMILIASAVCEMVFVWVPARRGVKNIIHTTAASFVGMAMFALIVLLAFYGSKISLAGFVASAIFLMTTYVLGILVFFKKFRRQLFLLETIYCVVFIVTMSMIAHF